MKPMLAGKFDEAKVAKRFPLYGQIKYDGIRAFIKDGVAYTRSLKPVRNEWIQSWVAHNKKWLNGLDGEFIVGDPTARDCYRKTMQFVMTYHTEEIPFTFYVFDTWVGDADFQFRWDMIYLPQTQNVAVKAPTQILLNMEDLWSYYREMMELGHEGIVLRAFDMPYKHGRGSPVKCELIKLKQESWVDTEGTIVEVHELMHNGNPGVRNELGYLEHSGHKDGMVPMNTLGAITVRGKWENGEEYECRIGSGFDAAERSRLWADRDTLPGAMVKFKYFTVGIKDKPRFPIYLGFRDALDIDPEDQFELL